MDCFSAISHVTARRKGIELDHERRMEIKLDIMAIAAHPDDVELGCGGTMIAEQRAGKKTGIIDLTQGELGTRGTPELRYKEAQASSKILGLSVRDILTMPDGFFGVTTPNLLRVAEQIRRFKPEIVLTNAVQDRHPDHGRGAELVSRACFLAGLAKVETQHKNQWQDPWRPRAVYHFIQDRYIHPDFVVDISDHFEQKMEAIRAFKSQFHDPGSTEPDTPISSPEFLSFLEARHREMGRIIGTTFGEGFTVERAPGVRSFDDLI